MARVEAVAKLEVRQWSLDFDKGWRRSLRVGGFFAGYPSREEMMDGIQRQQDRDERHRRESADEGLFSTNMEEEELDSGYDDGNGARGNVEEDDDERSPLASPDSTLIHASRVRNGRRRNFRVDEDDFEDAEQQEEQGSAEPPGNYAMDMEMEMEMEMEDAVEVPDFDRVNGGWEAETSAKPANGFSAETSAKPANGFSAEPSGNGEERGAIEIDDFLISTRLNGSYSIFPFVNLPRVVNGELDSEMDLMEEGGPSQLYLNGIFNGEREARRKKIEKWRLEFPLHGQPVFLVETKDGTWVKLCEPNDMYKKIMNSARAASSFLHYINRNPGTTKEAAKKEMRILCRQHASEESFAILSTYLSWIIQAAGGLFPRQVIPAIEGTSTFTEMFRGIVHISVVDASGKRWISNNKGVENGGGGRSAKRGKTTLVSLNSNDRLGAPSPRRVVPKSRKEIKNKGKGKAVDRGQGSLNNRHSSDEEGHLDESFEPNEDPPVCALCDDGGESVFCEGPCRRSFHANYDAGHASYCGGLGMSDLEVQRIDKFYCQNCVYQLQQCFLCGELGSSIPTTTSSQEVYSCGLPFCHRFYHLECLVDYHPFYENVDNDRTNPQMLLCPRHTCMVCQRRELEEPGKLVQCRRCPRGWHKRCLKEYSISHEYPETPIWDQYGRDYFYCSRHKILDKIQTPERNHVKFPGL